MSVPFGSALKIENSEIRDFLCSVIFNADRLSTAVVEKHISLIIFTSSVTAGAFIFNAKSPGRLRRRPATTACQDAGAIATVPEAP